MGASAAKIDETFPCIALWLLYRSLAIFDLDIVEHIAQGQAE